MRALVLVDIQNDFLPGGALAVAGGDEVVAVANRLAADRGRYGLVVATQDWHPPRHQSFASEHPPCVPGDVIDLDGLEQVLWPDHCVQGTSGAEFAPGLDQALLDAVVRKGTDPMVDSYSGFFDNARRHATGLETRLRQVGVDSVDVCGLATDYCVKFTVLDAVERGFDTTVVATGCRAVELSAGDGRAALEAMAAAGAVVVD